MKLKHLLSLSLLGLVAVPASAGQPQFTFEKVIDKAAVAGEFHPRLTAGEADANGGLYYTENASEDNIYYIPDPLVDQNTPGFSQLAFSASSLDGGMTFNAGSWMGITIDPNGTVFASGSGDNRTAVAMIKRSGLTITGTQVAMPSGYNVAPYIRLGGCAAVGVNRFVASGYSDGSLHFFTVNATDSTAFLEGVVSPPPGFSGIAPDVTVADGKIYMTKSVPGNATTGSNGGLWVWDTDGTHSGTNNPVQLVAPVVGNSSTINGHYNVLGYSAANKVIAVNEGHPATGSKGWKFYDATQVGAPWTSYLFLNGSETGAPGAIGDQSGQAAMGAVFFKKGTDEYFIGSCAASQKMYIYKIVPGSNVADWSVY